MQIFKTLKFILLINIFWISAPFWAYGWDGSLSHEQLQYVNSGYESNSVDGDLKEEWLELTIQNEDGKRFKRVMDFSARYNYRSNDYLVSVPQAYIGFNSDTSGLALGRKLLDWESSDKFWGVSGINGKQGFHLLDNTQEGLVGLHYDFQSNWWDVSFFGTYLYIPELNNPGFQFEDGLIKTKSIWGRRPPTHAEVRGKSVPIYYQLQDPNIGNIVFRESLGINLAFKWNSGKISGYGIYKPENRIRVNAEGYLAQSQETVNVNVDPFVNQHFVYGLQLRQRFGDLKVNTGTFVIDPDGSIMADLYNGEKIVLDSDRPQFQSDYVEIKPNYLKKNYYHINLEIEKDFLDVSLNYLQLLNELGSVQESIIEGPTRWIRAVGILLRYSFIDSFSSLLDIKHDMEMKDTVIKSEHSYRFRNKVAVGLGIELLRASNNNSYWSSYRANDNVYARMGYLF